MLKQRQKPAVITARSQKSTVRKTGRRTFTDFVIPLIPKPEESGAKITSLQGALLAHLQYTNELALKNKALRLFWRHNRLPGTPESALASPRPRNYRTTSKRKTVLHKTNLYFIFGKKLHPSQKTPFQESPLEPLEHTTIYNFLQKELSGTKFKLLANHLNYIVIRGSYKERAVIFNIDTLNGPLIHKIKIIANKLRNLTEKIIAAYIYPDPSHSDYYLENRRPANLLNFKKLFGKANLTVSYNGCRLNYHPTSFSQVNESIVPIMLNKTREMLAPDSGERLLDLYCGYGLFSHFLASDYKKVLGIDAEGPSIRSAIANSKINSASSHTRFIAHKITDHLNQVLPPSAMPETIILDPPRQGPQKNVVSMLCRRKPQQVLHIFCGVDQIPSALQEWRDNGYRPCRVVPLDMFPGTANLEILILLQPSATTNKPAPV